MARSKKSVRRRYIGTAAIALAAACLGSSLAHRGQAQTVTAGTFDVRPRPAMVEFLPALPESEKRILAALDEPTTLEFQQTPLEQAIAFLKDKHHIEIQLRERTLNDAGVGSDAPLTCDVKDISLRSALKLMLSSLGLTFLVNDEVLKITTEEDADTITTTRTYPVGDLIIGEDYDSLVHVMTSIVRPSTWDEVGGPGSIQEVRAAKSLVISQTYEVHDEILTLLRSLRAAQKIANGN